MKKAPILSVPTDPTVPYEDIHYDISDPVTPSLGGSIYTALFMERWTAKSDVFFERPKPDLMRNVAYYTATVESQFET